MPRFKNFKKSVKVISKDFSKRYQSIGIDKIEIKEVKAEEERKLFK